jgi:hypothetical protein
MMVTEGAANLDYTVAYLFKMQPLHIQNKFKTMNDINEILRIKKINLKQ